MMRLNKKQKLFTAVLSCLAIIAGIYLFYFLNRTNDFNILLITVDALRPDHLGCYGYKQNTSPNIDKLAKEGILFTQAISQGPWTGASLPSLFTSTYPSMHKVISSWQDSIDESLFTLPQILKNNAFYTGVICAHDFFVSILGLKKGFITFSIGSDLPAEEVTRRAMLWIEANKNKKFFLWLHYFDPHQPYRPPPHIKIDIDNIKSNNKRVPILTKRPEDPDIYGGLGGVPDYTIVNGRRDMGYYISLYDGEIEYADEQIGILLDKLKAWDLDKNTLIILTADHGEALGEHNLYFTHGENLYDELLRVPLIIKLGELFPHNKIIHQQVALIDIMPTVFHILRIRWSKQMEGVSLLPLILEKDNYHRLFVFSELGRTKSIRTSGWKLIYDSGNKEYELYNLKEDPKELTNLVEMEKDKFQFLKQRLDSFIEHTPINITKPKRTLDEETKRKLKSLGYLQ